MECINLVNELSSVLSKKNFDNPIRIVEELISYHLGCGCLEIYSKKIDEINHILNDFERILKNEPLQYVIGNVNFYGNTFKCDNRALIPRPETEILVESVIQSKIWSKEKISILEIGTGTGCISISLAKLREKISIDSIDISLKALDLAKQNYLLNNVKEPINFIHTDFKNFKTTTIYDIIISNPPYISLKDWKDLSPSVKKYEPKSALIGGIDGTEFINLIIKKSELFLETGGEIFLEIGFDQSPKVKDLLSSNGFNDINITNDIQNIPRIINAKYKLPK